MSKKKKGKIENSVPQVCPCPKFTCIVTCLQKIIIILIMTVSIVLIYTGVNFNTQPPKLHEDDGRRSMYTRGQHSALTLQALGWADPDCSMRTGRLWGFILRDNPLQKQG